MDVGSSGRAFRGRGSGVRRLRGGRAPTAGKRGGARPEVGRGARTWGGEAPALARGPGDGGHRGNAPESG